MPNPYEGKSSRRASEVRSELDHFVVRLRALGADDDQVEAVVEHWDDLDPEFTAEDRYQLGRLGDAELLDMIRQSRDEYVAGTTTVDEEAERAAAVLADAVRVEAHDKVGGTVAQVLEWVNDTDDPALRVARAGAVLDFETGPDGANRVTLVEPLEELVTDPEG